MRAFNTLVSLALGAASLITGCASLPRGSDPFHAPPLAQPQSALPVGVDPALGRPAPLAPAELAIDFALSQVGRAYCRGGEGPRCYDCSGLVQVAWARAGVRLPRTSEQQAEALPEVPFTDLRAGDVLWWPGHVALYAGQGDIIEARGVREGVVRRRLRVLPVRALRPPLGSRLASSP